MKALLDSVWSQIDPRFAYPIVIALVSILSACGTVKAVQVANDLQPNISINRTHYEINGTTADELRSQMDQLGPEDEFGQRHDAFTEWYIDWSYPYSIVNKDCATGPIEVTITITSTFPKWNNPQDASKELVNKWNAYLSILQTHEDGHKQIAIDAGNEILRTLSALPAYPLCSELEQTVDANGQNILGQFRKKEIIYDQKTAHGENQGAHFP
jgi:predicted secreted Zn-dependent protease